MLSDTDFQHALDCFTQGICLRQAGLAEEALQHLGEALRLAPQLLPARFERATLLAERHRYDDALLDFDLCLAQQPEDESMHSLRQQAWQAGLAYHDDLLKATSADANLWFRRGRLYALGGYYEQAVGDLTQALLLDAEHQDALNILGDSLLALNRPTEALAGYTRLLALRPTDAHIWFNHGNVLRQLNLLDEAIQSYRHAIALNPDYAEAHLEWAHCQLAQGMYQEGWARYEWRWKTAQLAPHFLPSPAPLWLGRENIQDKRILLWAEQGFGDTLQFVRYARAVADLGAQVTLLVMSPLLELFQQLDPRIAVIDPSMPIPAHDFHCPLMSLPLALGGTDSDFGGPAPYLHADPQKVALWQQRLGTRRRPRIGIVWSGRRIGPRNITRDMSLAQLQPLLQQDADFICLQKEISEEEHAVLGHFPNLRHFQAELSSFAETAALMACLDCVISVDTAAAHLAGALGMPCHLLLRHFGEWRWLQSRQDSPWYPSLRLYHQKALGDWSGAVGMLCSSLDNTLIHPGGISC
ncbi:tetratricopeptide repeat protein [Uliginosibacterium gangwonense]|uniref:tetratricopeptide repeat protein n=1 Tax=Uliginosibacterium gangwonense TaxID=392736 RepID=UPI00038280E6|nr:tetratricopeptide repeat protein [Uliginosibacterium gangwonense]